MAKTGRPLKELDENTFEGLCGIQCTLSEIASVLRVSEDTVERWCKRHYEMPFAECFKKYSSLGKVSLRRTQFKLAQRNASMAIWLGKQYLGQRDVQELKADVNTTESKRNPFDELDVETLEKLAHYGEDDGSGGNPA